MTGTYKVRVKIGDAEFEAEGPEEIVKQQYADFLGALSAPTVAHKQTTEVNNSDGDRRLIDGAFETDGDVVSLKFLPATENQQPDTLILLLYGYEKVKGQPMVLGTQLLKAARKTGLQIDRVDRPIAAHESLLLRGGTRKGMKYGLNNLGKAKAAELLKKME